MSPLIIDRIKKSGGKARIIAKESQYLLQVLENGSWTTLLEKDGEDGKKICEQVLRKATSQVLLG